jgi:hypothetical protein
MNPSNHPASPVDDAILRLKKYERRFLACVCSEGQIEQFDHDWWGGASPITARLWRLGLVIAPGMKLNTEPRHPWFVRPTFFGHQVVKRLKLMGEFDVRS